MSETPAPNPHATLEAEVSRYVEAGWRLLQMGEIAAQLEANGWLLLLEVAPSGVVNATRQQMSPPPQPTATAGRQDGRRPRVSPFVMLWLLLAGGCIGGLCGYEFLVQLSRVPR